MVYILNSVKNLVVALLFLTINILLFPSCVKEKEVIYSGNPEILKVRLVDSTKRDSTFTQAFPGTLIAIEGKNLGGIKTVYFNDKAATFNPSFNTENSLIVTIPASAPTMATKPDVSNQIKIITSHGETTYNFVLTPPLPSIRFIENENPHPGDMMKIVGADLRLVQKVVFPGNLESTTLQESADGKTLVVKVPDALLPQQYGPIKIVTKFGEMTSMEIINNTMAPNMLVNFDGIGANDPTPENTVNTKTAPVKNDPTLFPGNWGYYSHMKTGPIAVNNFSYKDGTRAIWTEFIKWIPDENLKDPLDSWAMKFEIFANEFENATLAIIPAELGAWDEVHRFEPWNTQMLPPGTKMVYPSYTKGKWVTITIPFTEFRNKASNIDGYGVPAANMREFLEFEAGTSLPRKPLNEVVKFLLLGHGSIPGLAASPGVDIAIDNIRTAKIR